MENVLKYYEFSDFFKDKSDTFSNNEISFSELNAVHFLIFERNEARYNLYVSKYASKKEIGIKPPEILELMIQDYDKSIPEHRIAIRRYFH
ncbi:conserved hypothetical protein [Tenacibaculum maritimum]|uniref:hypothetical protein n=1 Tax=Tenacibaculum maritimum TaxID=107401 RepID=UPI0012E64C89|nr:hypothetical protein [Tenacibaculum maritimum]CAA0253335.1 conserved hypothetical protein [Tenacibaculum maritimum]CAA0261377.1 conserved hypothetical protein [Tenacibaculum maritimum]